MSRWSLVLTCRVFEIPWCITLGFSTFQFKVLWFYQNLSSLHRWSMEHLLHIKVEIFKHDTYLNVSSFIKVDYLCSQKDSSQIDLVWNSISGTWNTTVRVFSKISSWYTVPGEWWRSYFTCSYVWQRTPYSFPAEHLSNLDFWKVLSPMPNGALSFFSLVWLWEHHLLFTFPISLIPSLQKT